MDFAEYVKGIMPNCLADMKAIHWRVLLGVPELGAMLTEQSSALTGGLIRHKLTYIGYAPPPGDSMARSRKAGPKDGKVRALRKHGTLNPRADRVSDPLFADSDFFDARDLVQVKYEMVRRVRADGQRVSHSAAAFGMSRPTFYQAQAALDEGGMAALVPQKPGPRRAHKLDAEVVSFLVRLRSEDASLRPAELAERVRVRFGRKVHPRSVERALARQEKKRP